VETAENATMAPRLSKVQKLELLEAHNMLNKLEKIKLRSMRVKKEWQYSFDTIHILLAYIKSLEAATKFAKKKELELLAQHRSPNIIHEYRTLYLAREQRCHLLAYAFIRGLKYFTVENNPRWKRAPYDRMAPEWTKIANIIINHSTVHKHQTRDDILDKLRLWRGN
jgi:hypothetical protein